LYNTKRMTVTGDQHKLSKMCSYRV
jgi:hypothetical protein